MTCVSISYSNFHQCGSTYIIKPIINIVCIGNVNVHVTGEAVLYIISESDNTIKYDNDNLLIVCAKGTLYALTCLLENMKMYIFH